MEQLSRWSILLILLVSAAFPIGLVRAQLSIAIEPSKPSYMVGETVTLSMLSKAPTEYSLRIRKPDGGIWPAVHGILPATFTKKATEPIETYTAKLKAHYYTAHSMLVSTSTSFSVVSSGDTYEVTISLAGLPTDFATALRVDGNKVAAMKSGDVRVLSFTMKTTHTFQVDQHVIGAAGYRYYCSSSTWTAGAAASNVFNYATQVYLDVSTHPSGICVCGCLIPRRSLLIPPFFLSVLAGLHAAHIHSRSQGAHFVSRLQVTHSILALIGAWCRRV